MKTTLKAIVGFVAVVIFSLFFVVLTPVGNRWLWNIACQHIDGLQGELVEGSIQKTLTFKNPGWVQKGVQVSADQVLLHLDVNGLLHKRLKLYNLDITNLQIKLADEPTTANPSEKTPITLSEIQLPIPVDIQHLLIDRLCFQQGDTKEELKQLTLTAQAEGSEISITRLDLKDSMFTSRLTGQITLSGNYPLSLKADIQPVSTNQQVQALPVTPGDIQARVSGSLKNYDLTVSTVIEAPLLPGKTLPFTANLTASGDLEKLNIKKLILHDPEQGNLTISGNLNWKDGLLWNGSATIESFTTDVLLPEYPGTLSGDIHTRFSTGESGWQLSMTKLFIEGNLRGHPVHASGSVDLNSYLTGQINRLNLSFGNNQLFVQGTLKDTLDITAKLSASELGIIHPNLSGDINSFVHLTGDKNAPDIRYDLHSKTLGFNNTVVNHVKLAGNIDARKRNQLTLSTQIDNVSVELAAQGQFKNNTWQGQLTRAHINSPVGNWSLVSPASLQIKNRTADLKDFCLVSSPSQLCLNQLQASEASVRANLTLSQLNTEKITPFFPEGFDWQALLSGSADVTWQQNQPFVKLHLESTPGNIKALNLQGRYTQFTIDTELNNNLLNSALNFASPSLGNSSFNISVSDLQGKRNLQGRFNIDAFLLAVLNPLVPEINNLKGSLSANGLLSGTLKAPLIDSKLSLTDVALSASHELVKVTETQLNLSTKGSSANVSGSLKVNDGVVKLGGNISWKNTPTVTGQLSLKGDHLDFQYPGYGKAEVSPDLMLTLGELVELTGVVFIPSARIQVKSLPDSAITPSEDVVVITPNTAGTSTRTSHERFKMNVTVTLGDNIKLNALGLRARLEGQIKLQQQPDKTLEGQGTIDLIDGRLRKFGQDLLIEEGHIIFQGPLDTPYLIINAYRNPDNIRDNVVVGINVTGTVLDPQWSIYSTPDMSQEDQLSYLLRGHGMTEEGDSLASTLVNLGVGQLGGFVSSAGESLGFSDVVLDTEGTGDDTKVTIGGYIAPGLRLQYGAGVFNSLGEVKVRYELMPRLFLQAISGLGQAVDLFYQFTIGPNPAPEKTKR